MPGAMDGKPSCITHIFLKAKQSQIKGISVIAPISKQDWLNTIPGSAGTRPSIAPGEWFFTWLSQIKKKLSVLRNISSLDQAIPLPKGISESEAGLMHVIYCSELRPGKLCLLSVPTSSGKNVKVRVKFILHVWRKSGACCDIILP